MSLGSVRKPRAADRPCYFIILLWLRSGCSAHRSSQTNNRSSPIVTETPTKHCTPLALALKLVPSGCRQSMQLHCTKGAELPVSASRTGRAGLAVSAGCCAMPLAERRGDVGMRARGAALSLPLALSRGDAIGGGVVYATKIESEDTLLTHALDPTPRRLLRVKPTPPLDPPYPN